MAFFDDIRVSTRARGASPQLVEGAVVAPRTDPDQPGQYPSVEPGSHGATSSKCCSWQHVSRTLMQWFRKPT